MVFHIMMIPGAKVQKAARACTMRLLMGLFNRCKSNKKWVGIKQKEKE